MAVYLSHIFTLILVIEFILLISLISSLLSRFYLSLFLLVSYTFIGYIIFLGIFTFNAQVKTG